MPGTLFAEQRDRTGCKIFPLGEFFFSLFFLWEVMCVCVWGGSIPELKLLGGFSAAWIGVGVGRKPLKPYSRLWANDLILCLCFLICETGCLEDSEFNMSQVFRTEHATQFALQKCKCIFKYVYKARAASWDAGLLPAMCAGGSIFSPAGPPATPSPVVLSLQQLKLVFDAVAGVRGGEFELLG